MKFLAFLPVAASMFVCACGGGGGSSSSPQPPTPPPLTTVRATIAPAQISLRAVDGQYAPLRLEARLDTPTPPGAAHRFVFDTNIFDRVSETQNGNTFTLNLRLRTESRLAQTAGSIQFSLCETSSCQQVYPGSTVSTQFLVGVDIAETVAPGRNELGSNYVGLTLRGPQDFQKLWELPISAVSSEEFSTFGGLAFLAGTSATEFWVTAIDIATGAERWRQSVPRNSSSTPPRVAASGGLVFFGALTQLLQNPDEDVYVFDAHTGALLYRTVRHPESRVRAANGAIYERVSEFGPGMQTDTLASRDPTTGQITWTRTLTGRSGDFAVDRALIYRVEDSDLAIYRRDNGLLERRLPGNQISSGGAVSLTPFGEAVVRSFEDVSLFDLSAGARRWSNSISSNALIVRPPAISSGKIFVCKAGGFVGWLDASTGLESAIQVDVGAPNAPVCLSLLATRNLLFASGPFKTVALDINNNLNQVWSYDASSIVAITPEGILLVGETGYDFVGQLRRDWKKIVAYKIAD